jgi:hypothetical protein
MRVKENRKKKSNTLMGRIKGVHHCLQDQQQGFAKKYSDDVFASPTNNTRKRKRTIPAVDSPTMATRGKRENKLVLACWF